jgi:hypothetical protein
MSDALADDLLWGIEAIGAYLGLGKRQADHALRSGRLPYRRVGRLIVSSKRALKQHFAIEPLADPAAPAAQTSKPKRAEAEAQSP